ncbi:MAG: spore cortex biosynthesis protein YabQ [Lachnospiraceae bacterium]|nr:spore cortex biosynthesis protein YabQ [Lachnospiraceae bacterium]MDD3795964.1 spore cortex biosynthesis protein YabQ [Lachnospiraceae bacterium]
MSEVIYYEVKVFLIFALYGMFLLLGYDGIRAWRRAVRHGVWWIAAEDGLFWFAAGIATFVMIFIYQDGTLRLYTAAAVGSGMYLYSKIFSKWVVKGTAAVLCLFFRIFSQILKKIDDFCQKIVAKFVKKD